MAKIGTDIKHAADLLRAGQLVAIPTETVYGLAGNGLEENALLTIYQVKNRPSFDPLILHVSHLQAAEALVVDIPEPARQLAEAFWPGPLTVLLKKLPVVPDIATSGLAHVAIRVPAHPLTQALLAELDFPLAAPSANPFGYISPTTAQHVNDQLGNAIPYILDGGSCRVGIESTIIGFEDNRPVVYRLGGMRLEDIEAHAGPVSYPGPEDNPAAPGMLKSHYAPTKPLYIGDIKALMRDWADKRFGILSWRESYSNPRAHLQIILSPEGSLPQAASRLFAALRQLDQAPIDVILSERFPDEGLGHAINDRLQRASIR